jgi:hypothetical protein
MIQDKRWSAIIAALLLVGLVTVACSPTGGGEAPEATQPSSAPRGQCGDGVCDEAEKADPDLCPQDCPTAAPAVTQPPPPPTSPPPTSMPPTDTPPPRPAGKCGDGICDELEQQDPDLCPQDCPQLPSDTPGAIPAPASGEPDYEPPINIYLVLHIDPLGAQEDPTFKPEQGMYVRTRDEIDWLADEAARHGLRLTSLYNGWFTKWALDNNDLDQFQALLAGGHELGSHAHQIYYDPGTDAWIKCPEELSIFGHPNYDPGLARQCWNDADSYLDSLLTRIDASGQNQIMCSTALSLSDEDDMMAEFGFTIACGNRLEKGINYLGHMVWNPWRAANSDEPGHELAEDLSASYPTFNHLAQIGGGGSIGMPAEAHGQDLTLPQMQRRFLMLYAEWLARERNGSEDRVWAFGWVYHPNYGDRYNRETSEFLDWLDQHFVGQASPHGHTIARYATVGEIADEFRDWEAAYPDTSSFHYVQGDPYPYTYAVIPAMLENAAYEAHVNLGSGVSCFRFSRDGQPVYMLWSDSGEGVLNFSSELRGQVRVTNAAGQESVLDAASLTLSEEPLFVQP